MSWDDDDFEAQLNQYSEIETIPKEQFCAALPKTIQQYHERIQSNNSTSIFDADYTLDSTASDSEHTNEVKKELKDNVGGAFKDNAVTYVISGRGRGGRNMIIKPGDFNTTRSDDDEIRQQIRKVAPLGYSNEITENAWRAHQMAKQREQGLTNINHNAPKPVSPVISKTSSPIVSKTSSPIISKTSSPVASKSSLELESLSTSSSSTKMDLQKSSVSTASSSSFAFQDRNGCSSSSKSNQNQEEIDDSELEDAKVSTSSASIGQSASQPNTGAIPKTSQKPLPLSVMLQNSRKAHRQKQLGHSAGFKADSIDPSVEERLSQIAIQEILKQDRLEDDKRRKQLEKSPSSVGSSGNEGLSWRRRTNSPPRYSWGAINRKKDRNHLDIDSIDDFPALK